MFAKHTSTRGSKITFFISLKMAVSVSYKSHFISKWAFTKQLQIENKILKK